MTNDEAIILAKEIANSKAPEAVIAKAITDVDLFATNTFDSLTDVIDVVSEVETEILAVKESIKNIGNLTKGEDGRDGVDGKDGLNGKDGNDGKDGKDGVNGKNGADGKDGADGISITDEEKLKAVEDIKKSLNIDIGYFDSKVNNLESLNKSTKKKLDKIDKEFIPKGIRDLLMELDGEERLDAKYIKNIPTNSHAFSNAASRYLSQLADVRITNITTGDLLQWNGTSWINTPYDNNGILSLNGLTGATQTFAVTTAGTDFTISSAGTVHSFNLPTASATVRGALSSADWITFNNKLDIAGNDTNIMYNASGVLGGTNDLYWDYTNKIFGAGDISATGNNTIFTVDDTHTSASLSGNFEIVARPSTGVKDFGLGLPLTDAAPVFTEFGFYINRNGYFTWYNSTIAFSAFHDIGAITRDRAYQWQDKDGVVALWTDNISNFTNDVGYITSAALTGYVPYTGATANVNIGSFIFIGSSLRANTSAGVLIEASNGTDVGILGVGNTANVTWYGAHNFSAATQDTLAAFVGAGKTLSSLDLATYPSLTEISYVKGVTSAIQTQLNAKEPTITAGTTAQYWRGDKSWQTLNTANVPELTNLYFTNARAIASTLTGYVSGAGTISSSDSILQAIQKLNGNIGALVTGVSSVNSLTGAVSLVGTSNQIVVSGGTWSLASTITGLTSVTSTTFVGALTGNATTATTATNTTITDNTILNATVYPTWVTASSGNLPQQVTSTKLSFNPFMGSLTATSFIGNLTGNADTITVANEATDTTCFIGFYTSATGSLGGKTNTALTYNSNTALLSTTGLTVTNAPTFSAMTAKSVLFAGTSGLLSQDNTNFAYDSTIRGLGIGTIPTARLHIADDDSQPNRGTSGTQINQASAVHTNTTSSGTVSVNTANSFFGGALAATNTVTYTTATALYVSAPTASTNVTITDSYGIYCVGGILATTKFTIGSTVSSARFTIGGNSSLAAWGNNGAVYRMLAATYTDTSTSASTTVATAHANSFLGITIAATNASVTYTRSATMFIGGAPTAGTNVTITNAYSLYVNAGNAYFADNVSINTFNTSAELNVASLTEQLRLEYSTAVIASFTVSSLGDLQIAPSSSGGARQTSLVGAMALPWESVSVTTTLGKTHYAIEFDCSGGARTANLPTAASSFVNGTGRIYVIRKSDSSANTLTIDGNGSETINGTTTKVINAQYGTYVIQSNGTSWGVISVI